MSIAGLFTHLKDLDACGTFEPARSLTSVVYSSEGAKGLSASELGLSYVLNLCNFDGGAVTLTKELKC